MNTGGYPCFLGSASHSFTSTTHNHPPQPSIDLVNSLDKKCWHITSQGCVVRSAHLAEGQSSSGVLWSAEQVMLLQVCPGCDRGCSYYLLCRLTTASRTQWIITGHLRSVSTDSSLPGVSLIQSCQYTQYFSCVRTVSSFALESMRCASIPGHCDQLSRPGQLALYRARCSHQLVTRDGSGSGILPLVALSNPVTICSLQRYAGQPGASVRVSSELQCSGYWTGHCSSSIIICWLFRSYFTDELFSQNDLNLKDFWEKTFGIWTSHTQPFST